jgi:thiosulfate dehydrogenase
MRRWFGASSIVALALYAWGIGALPLAGQEAPPPTPEPLTAPWTPKNIDRDPLPNDPRRSALIRRGAEVANRTPELAGQYVGSSLACTSCHLNGGQQVGAWPWVGSPQNYPQHDNRSGRTIDFAERLQSCFLRSENGTAPPVDDPVIAALTAYIDWISEGQPLGPNSDWRRDDTIPEAARIPIDQLQPQQGRALYAARCAECHAVDGQGVGDIPPLWGPRSYNDGAGTGRVYTLAGFLHRAMPLAPRTNLTYEEAQQIAAYVDSQPRPVYPGQAQDYPNGDVPVDAVYYPQRYPHNPLQR